MKKLLTLSILAMSSLCLKAQYTSLRTNRVVTLVSTAEAAGADTIRFTPIEWRTIVKSSATITDTVCYGIKDLSRCHLGDELIIMATNSSGSGHKVKLTGTWYEVSGSDSVLALTSAKRAVIKFIFDGAKFVETGKIVQ